MNEGLFEQLQDALAGQWSIERKIGRGAMGTVFLARDVTLDRPVAIKLLHPELAADPAQRERFLNEARIGARLIHPNIVPILDVGTAGDLVYFTMGLVDGEALSVKLAREGAFSPEVAERTLREVGWALAAAHATGTLHRDVTLDNILVDRHTGTVALADFGIAAPVESDAASELVGTPAYIAPELIGGEPATPASDLYALGIVGWSLMTGHLPFIEEEPGKVLIRQLTDTIPPLKEAAPHTPRKLARAIDGLLDKSPDNRPSNAEAWLATLDAHNDVARLAGPLQHWLENGGNIKPYYAVGLTIVGTLGALGMFGANYLDFGIAEVILRAGVAVALGIGLVHFFSSMKAVRNAAQQGYRIEDLRLTLTKGNPTRKPVGQRSLLLSKLLRTAIGLAALTTLALGTVLFVWDEFAASLPFGVKLWLSEFGIGVLRWSWVIFWAGLGGKLLLPSPVPKESSLGRRIRKWFWSGKVGSGLFKGAAIGLGAQQPKHTLHRPTELVVGLQVEELWKALPQQMQIAHSELPRLAASLRRRISELRELAHATAGAVGEAAEQRAKVIEYRDSAIAQLERLRLLAMELAGQVDDASEFTQQLRDARELESELLMELGARSELGRLVAGRSG